ncbi:putative receptor protein kinase ZmPK1 [Morella rubra]|uniref:Putative receptor protein kinase ZmPK1 n=1 Tax=Morella rubra TaxID=262757 RepID=A0A6A1W6N5_9ROSI|nr:putative receptor protein kinase ZmPK1 [Morella rubra]
MATAQQSNFNFNLSRGSSLSPTGNSSLLSQSLIFAFGFFPFGDGFAVGIWFESTPQKTVVWTANRNYPPHSRNATIVLSSDGWLISRELGGQERTIANSTKPALSASLLDSGNLVLYNSDSQLIWQSFDFPTDTLLPGQLLRAGNELVSSYSETNHSIGIFRIVMQNDGNVVMYPVGSGDPYWAAQTNAIGQNASITLDKSDRLYIVDRTGIEATTIFDAATKPDLKTFRATIDADGIFRLYSQSSRLE